MVFKGALGLQWCFALDDLDHIFCNRIDVVRGCFCFLLFKRREDFCGRLSSFFFTILWEILIKRSNRISKGGEES